MNGDPRESLLIEFPLAGTWRVVVNGYFSPEGDTFSGFVQLKPLTSGIQELADALIMIILDVEEELKEEIYLTVFSLELQTQDAVLEVELL